MRLPCKELVYEDGKRINNSRRKRFIIIKRGFRKNETLNIIIYKYLMRYFVQ